MTDQHGFTLVEMIVALALFALIALAGLGLVEGVLGVGTRTDGRLERLADLDRALFVMKADLMQLADAPVSGGGGRLDFARPLALGGLPAAVRYDLAGGNWVRDGAGTRQTLLPGVAALRFRFWTGQGWADRWPPDRTRLAERPRAIEAVATLAGPPPGGTIRRVVALPERP